MKQTLFLLLCLWGGLTSSFAASAFAADNDIPEQTSAHSADVQGKAFQAGKGTFLLHGEPFLIRAAELHYPCIPRPYWEHRIKMCKALDMNTICLYVF